MTVKYDPAVGLAYAKHAARRIMSDHEAANYDESVYTQRIAALEADLAEAQALLAESAMGNADIELAFEQRDQFRERIERLSAALTLLTDGFKYSTDVVTIARTALTQLETTCEHRWCISNTATKTCYACGATKQGNGPIEPSAKNRGTKP
jgi:hypothetical protein